MERLGDKEPEKVQEINLNFCCPMNPLSRLWKGDFCFNKAVQLKNCFTIYF
jgi:hypothetical protein